MRLFPVFSALLLGSAFGALHAAVPTIDYSQIVAHPALTAIYDGMVQELKEKGYAKDKDYQLDYQIAQGDMGLNAQIAQKFAGDNPTVIVASTTPSAQAVLAAVHGRIPVVFTGITDPIGARLVSNLEKPGKNVTGVKESIAYDAMLTTIHDILPKATRIGTIYNTGEQNSLTSNEILNQKITAKGWQFIAAPVQNSGGVLEAARSLVGKVDVIVTTLDNTVASALPSVVQVADGNKIPLFTFDTFSVPKGASVGVGYDEYDVGRLTADKVIQILKGTKPGDIPVSAVEKTRIVLNKQAAAKQGVALTPDIIAKATQVID